MAPEPNPYRERLGISVPSLVAARTHRVANTYALLIVMGDLAHGEDLSPTGPLELRNDIG